MKRGLMIIFSSLILITACSSKETNPFLSEWNTPFGTPPFEQIKLEHYIPAFEAGFKAQNEEIAQIINNKDEATFENTIVALDLSGSLFRKVNRVFNAMNGAMSSEEL